MPRGRSEATCMYFMVSLARFTRTCDCRLDKVHAGVPEHCTTRTPLLEAGGFLVERTRDLALRRKVEEGEANPRIP